MKLRQHADKIAYFFIAFAVYLLIRSLIIYMGGSVLTSVLYTSIAVSLLASNIPRVLDIPIRYAYPARCVEYFSFCASVIFFIILCIKHIL